VSCFRRFSFKTPRLLLPLVVWLERRLIPRQHWRVILCTAARERTGQRKWGQWTKINTYWLNKYISKPSSNNLLSTVHLFAYLLRLRSASKPWQSQITRFLPPVRQFKTFQAAIYRGQILITFSDNSVQCNIQYSQKIQSIHMGPHHTQRESTARVMKSCSIRKHSILLRYKQRRLWDQPCLYLQPVDFVLIES
jgi:hypothetical protein